MKKPGPKGRQTAVYGHTGHTRELVGNRTVVNVTGFNLGSVMRRNKWLTLAQMHTTPFHFPFHLDRKGTESLWTIRGNIPKIRDIVSEDRVISAGSYCICGQWRCLLMENLSPFS